MNYSLAVLLLNEDTCRAIKAIYEPDPTDDKLPKAKRELFKTFDPEIAVGDIVMVPSTTRHKVTTVKVVEVDVEWDVHTSGEVKWIIGKVDQTEFEKLKDIESKAIAAIKESEKTAARKKLKAQMFEHLDEQELKALAAKTAEVAQIEHK